MTINRDKQQVYLVSYENSTDEYGQTHLEIKDKHLIEMTIKEFSVMTNATPMYLDTEAIGLTKHNISEGQKIITKSGTAYRIIRVLHNGRLNEAFMKKLDE